MAGSRICLVDGCSNAAKSIGLCGKHYQNPKYRPLGVRARNERGKFKNCTSPGCDRPVEARALCSKHYGEYRAKVGTGGPCRAFECSNPAITAGLCATHYVRHKKSGTVENYHNAEMKAFIELTLTSATDECILWPFYDKPYPRVTRNGKVQRANRYFCEHAHGVPPFADAQAAHNCGHRLCVNPRHLRWDTAKSNTADKWLHGTMIHGERHHLCKLSEADVLAIRAIQSPNRARIAEQYGMARSTINAIIARKIWKHI